MTRRLISADSHVFEPMGLWETRLPERFRELAPRREKVKGRTVLSMGGKVVFSLKQDDDGPAGGDGEIGDLGGADLGKRLSDLEGDGVVGEVIYPTIGLFVLSIPDRELALASAQVYNDWAAEVFLERGDIFAPVALIPVVDVQDAVAEVERVAGMGFRAVCPPLQAPEQLLYNDPAYDPLWKTAEEVGIPLSMHVGTGIRPVSERGPGGAIINYLRVGLGAQDAVAYFAAGGILARHPGLHVVIAEAGAGWLGYACERMDEAFEEHAQWVNPKLDEPPSSYVRRQMSITFGAERAPLLNLEVTSAQPLMWASDYPHPEGTWPESQRHVEESVHGMPEDAVEAIVGGNAARVYGFSP